jgi:hypothetical protein
MGSKIFMTLRPVSNVRIRLPRIMIIVITKPLDIKTKDGFLGISIPRMF